MLELVTTPVMELARLDSALSAYRVKLMREALEGRGIATTSPESEAETKRIVETVRAWYRSAEWTDRFPPGEKETDPTVIRVLHGSRDNAINSMALLHRFIMEAPVIGCGSDPDVPPIRSDR